MECGYEVEVITNDHPDMYCMVCLKLMREPVQFRCSHGICKPCYGNLNAEADKRLPEICSADTLQNDLKKRPHCPSCRKEIDHNKVFSNDMLHRMILTVRVKCSNSIFGCYWTGNIGDLQDHYKECRHIIPSPKRKEMAKTKGETDDSSSHRHITIVCPYVTYGCGMKELSDKNLDKHLIDYAQYHLNICANTLTKGQDTEKLDSHQKYMAETLDGIFNILDTINQMISNFEEAKKSELDIIKNIFVDRLMPFHDMTEHVKVLEKYMHKVEYFVKSVGEYVEKFDKKSFLELSMPTVLDETSYSHDLLCRKISVSDVFRFDRERIHENRSELSKKLANLKKVHYNALILAKDVVEKLEKRDDDFEMHYSEEGILRMQKGFEVKVDSIMKVLDDAVNSISTSYRSSLIDFINDADKGHNYSDYYIWKIDATKLRQKGHATEYYKDISIGRSKKEAGDCLSIWSTVDTPTMDYDRSKTTGKIVVKYIVQVYKGDISGRIFCMSQYELDRIAPSQLIISKVKVGLERGTLYSILAEFPLSSLKKDCCVSDVFYFNTVIT